MNGLKPLSEKEYVSRKILGGSPAVCKRITVLKKSRCKIDDLPVSYKLVKSGGIVNEFEILSKINKPVKICRRVFHYKKIASTQTKIKQMAAENADEGVVIVADEQSGGYGRMKRFWSSAKGGLWFSFLLKPQIRPDEAAKLALVAAVALNRVFEKKYKIKSLLKWPNDILAEGKKISGIIAEMSAGQDIVNWAAVGIGINANNVLPEELKAVSASISEISGKNVDVSVLLANFIEEFDALYGDFQKNGFKNYADEYNSKSAFKESPVTVDTGFEIIKGINKGIDKDGRLMLDSGSGIIKIISGTLRGGINA